MDNYRPISLLPSISKLFEKVESNQVSEYFKKNNLFQDGQYAFRDHHSTELVNIELSDRIISALDEKQLPVTIYMDLSKAFNTLDHDTLLKKLNYYGISGTALEWFRSYLSHRSHYVELNGVSSSQTRITTGVPQGSILGPLLFLIYMNDISTIKPVVQIYTICRRHETVYRFRIFFTDFTIKRQRTTKHRAEGNKWLSFSK